MTESELLSKYKRCTKCDIYKRFSEFSPRKRTRDKLDHTCKSCNGISQHILKQKMKQDPIRYEEYLRKARERDELKRSDPFFTEYNDPQKHEKYRQNNKEKANARAMINRRIKKGIIVKLPCQICGNTKSQGHHEDYGKPLEVIWLCHKHHKEIHRKFNSEIRTKLGLI